MKISILPKTAPGKWSVWLAISFIVLFALVSILGATGQEGGPTFFSNLYLAIPGLLALVTGLAAFLIGIFSIIFLKERAILVFVAAGVGLLIIVFIVGDIFAPEV